MPVMTPQQVQAECQRLAGRGVHAAARTFTNLVKQLISVPAPRRIVTSRKGVRYYVATTKATPGAPPRKLSGRLRTSMATEWDAATNTARSGTNVKYGRKHEQGNHPFLIPTLDANLPQLAIVVGQEVQITTGGTA